MGARRDVRRVDGEWSDRTFADEDRAHDDARYGEQLEWGYAIPMVHRALAAPHVPATMLRLTATTRFAYWASLLHLAVYSFGWARPELALAHWYFSGRPDADVDDRLALIEAVWVEDGRFEELLAQLLRTGGPGGWWNVLGEHMRRPGAIGTSAASSAMPLREAPDGFVASVERRAASAELLGGPEVSPLVGGTDPLHLSLHLDGPLRRIDITPGMRERLVVDSSEGRAVVHLDGMVGWYRALMVLGDELPDLGGRSWKVDVHVATVGHLGTFRRSRDTGLWFSGRHRYHLWGADRPTGP
jgi:hypothetical protein